LNTDAAAIDDLEDSNLGIVPVGRAPAYLIYTSGSTGRPNGVVVSNAALANFLGAMRREPGLSESDILAAVTTVSFDIAALELYLPLLVGACVVVVPRVVATDGIALAALLAEERVTVMQATPATWRLLLEARWPGAPTFVALCGGEALPPDLARTLLQRVGCLWNLYGPTETTIWSTAGRVEADREPVTIGRPIANTQVYILDFSGQPVPVGMPGEIWIGGAGVASGYWRNPELTGRKFLPDPFAGRDVGGMIYRTGDMGRWLDNGSIVHMGRLDDQVKLRGFRIEPGEIEAALCAHEAIREAVVVIGGTTPERERLVAYIVYRPGQDLTTSEAREHLRASLPDYMIPSLFLGIDALPWTPNGKVDKRALPDPFRQGSNASSTYLAPESGAEQMIAGIWQEALAVERVGAEDNFFDLGGHSLLGLRVAAKIHERTGWRMPPYIMFQQTLRQIAALLAAEQLGRGAAG
jgi:amino acid adenylation domain-containing protein